MLFAAELGCPCSEDVLIKPEAVACHSWTIYADTSLTGTLNVALLGLFLSTKAETSETGVTGPIKSCRVMEG